MSVWTPEWRIKINGVEYTSLTLSNLTIQSGRTDIYRQPVAGYCRLQVKNNDLSSIDFDVNDGVTVEVKNDAGNWVILFGGNITDMNVAVSAAGGIGISQTISITALGALARLPKAVFTGNIAQGTDGHQIGEVLATVLFDSWNLVPAAETWNAYDATTQWEDAENNGYGEIDAGDYTLDAQNGVVSDIYTLVSNMATSGLGYLYESPNGLINYADSTHRTEYFAANGYVELDANHALAGNITTKKRSGDVRNSVTITYTQSGNSDVSDEDAASIALYGKLGQTISTTLKNQTDAEDQAAFYLSLRAYPQTVFDSITFALGNPEIDETDRTNLLGVFMGMPIDLHNLPVNMTNGEFQGFVEGWTFQATVSGIKLTMVVSPLAFSLQAFRWNSVPVTESWNTLSPTLDWEHATIVA
jgi:hypothetical protein